MQYFFMQYMSMCPMLFQLKRKTAELTKACEKHYELEQELAFYKIDHKFDTLGKPRPLSTDEEVRVNYTQV